MRRNDKGCGKEETLVRELTEADLANIYGGAKGNPGSPGVTGMPDLSGFHLPYGMSMPNLPNVVPSSPTGNSTPKGAGTPNGDSNSGAPGLGTLLGALPIGLPSM